MLILGLRPQCWLLLPPDDDNVGAQVRAYTKGGDNFAEFIHPLSLIHNLGRFLEAAQWLRPNLSPTLACAHSISPTRTHTHNMTPVNQLLHVEDINITRTPPGRRRRHSYGSRRRRNGGVFRAATCRRQFAPTATQPQHNNAHERRRCGGTT